MYKGTTEKAMIIEKETIMYCTQPTIWTLNLVHRLFRSLAAVASIFAFGSDDGGLSNPRGSSIQIAAP